MHGCETARADIGLIGLAVMGQNLVLNMNDHGYAVAVHNRTVAGIDAFLAGPARGTRVMGARSLPELAASLKRPRKVLLMVKAGRAVDDCIGRLAPLLEPGDVLIDGGNSHFSDTRRRTRSLAARGLLYIGAGISGGEQGARYGPAIMPGGDPRAWPLVKELLQAIAAKAPDGTPCCAWVGEQGAGHYVKMIHNGIEYGDMQIIAEAYHFMRDGLNLTPPEMRRIFARWNTGRLQSYLIQITRDIMAFPDADGAPLLERILDSAGQKGTGSWTAINSLELGIPVTLISEAVYARCLSAHRDERLAAAERFHRPRRTCMGARPALVADLRQALLAAKIVSYAQGFMLLRAAAHAYRWRLDFGQIALLWRAGCIIRSAFLERIAQAFARRPDLPNLLLDDYFGAIIRRCQGAWRRVAGEALRLGIPLPAITAALCFFDGYRSARLPANLIQAQRDYFGVHTYQRHDRPPGEWFHTRWEARHAPPRNDRSGT
jgi:6-phosphogluconate dehydrogenase